MPCNIAHLEPNERIRSLSCTSENIVVDPHVPIRRYYRSGIELLRMAKVYKEEGNLENSFILFMKFIILFVEKVQTHPEFSHYSAEDKIQKRIKLKEVLPEAEKLKLTLKSRYEKEYKVALAKQKELEAQVEHERAQQQLRFEEERLAEEVVHEKPEYIDTALESHSIPSVDRSTKPVSLMGTSLENTSAGLRTIIVPTVLMVKFMSLAQNNTDCNIETCGILAGILSQNKFLISHLLVPKQHGTSDSCSTENEEESFLYQDRHDLLTVGWIHTHPSQTAFLSSVDLHTHCSYQLMMPEAIAIVCSPKYDETGYFTLTPNHGLPYIANCRQNGFHPHPSEPPLFQAADHVSLTENRDISVVDLR